MGKRIDYKKYGEYAALYVDEVRRNFVNHYSPGRRRLRKRLIFRMWKRYGAGGTREIDIYFYEDPCEECSGLGDDYWINEDGEIESLCEVCSLYKSRKG